MKNSKLLLVDDEEVFSSHMAKLLTSRGYRVATASGGEAALRHLIAAEFDVVVLDLKMPGLDGIETLKAIKRGHPLVEVILLTGHGTLDSAVEGLKHGAFDYLLKPLNKAELAKTIRRAKDALLSEQSLLNTARSASTEQIVESIVQYLRLNYAGEINFSQIAADFSFSASYLTKIFREYTGKPPIRYLIEYRVQIAKGLLMDTNLTVKEVAERTGFVDPFYFSKCFKSYCGFSPSQYKEQFARVK